MGPRWFFEGFAVLIADQYLDSVKLSQDEVIKIIQGKREGSYEEFGFVLRGLVEKYSLALLVKKASFGKNEFRDFLGF